MEQISESIRQGQENQAHRSRLIKQIVLAVLTAGLLSLNWWFLSQALFDGKHVSYWAWPIITTAVWISAVSMLALSKPSKYIFWSVYLIGLATFITLMPKEILVIAGGVLFTILCWYFQRRIQDEETNQLNFSFRRTFANSQTVITYAILILLGFLLYTNVEQDFKQDRQGFYNQIAQNAIRGLPYLSQNNDRFDLGQNVREFFRGEAQRKYPGFDEAAPQTQEYIVDMVREDFSNQFGVDVDQNISLRIALTEVVSQRLQEALGQYERFLPLFFTIAVIALLRTIAFVFNWIVLFISWLVYKLLLTTGFFRLTKATVEVEKLIT